MLTGCPACHGVGVKEKWILGGSWLYMQSGEGALGQSKTGGQLPQAPREMERKDRQLPEQI